MIQRPERERAVKKVKKEPVPGSDTNGKKYSSLDEAWSDVLGMSGAVKHENWYQQAEDYWQRQPRTNTGMLSGVWELSAPDLAGTKSFLRSVLQRLGKKEFSLGLDVGAGVGRTTETLFTVMKKCDILDQNQGFLDQACKTLDATQLGDVYCVSAQDHVFDKKYDIIWVQWILLYLPDDDALRFLRAIEAALTEDGILCVKENVTRNGEFYIDREDNSVTRALPQYLELFRTAGWKIVYDEFNRGIPSALFPICMWYLEPVGRREKGGQKT